LKKSLAVAGRRFSFNVDLIEKKYCRQASGMVYDPLLEEVSGVLCVL